MNKPIILSILLAAEALTVPVLPAQAASHNAKVASLTTYTNGSVQVSLEGVSEMCDDPPSDNPNHALAFASPVVIPGFGELTQESIRPAVSVLLAAKLAGRPVLVSTKEQDGTCYIIVVALTE